MTKENKNTEKPVSQKRAIKHFWKYTGILFATALVLIVIAGAIQTYNLQEYKNANELETTTNQSALQSVKEINDSLTKQLDTTKKELEKLRKDSQTADEAYGQLEIKLSQMLIIINTQQIYINGARKAARQELEKLDRETLNEDLISAYNSLYDKLY